MCDAADPARVDPERPLRIALVEDDDEMRGLLASTLVGAGYELTSCRSGLELLELLDAPDGGPAPLDLVISDVRLPGITGLSLLEGIQAWGGAPSPRMILITAFASPELHARAQRFGAVAVLDKPFKLEELLAAVAEALSGPGRLD